jgi:CRISPR-associated endoribonuclease Cas6
MVVAMVSAFFNAKENTMALALGKTRVRVTEVESVLSGPPWRYCEELIEEAAEERQIGLEFLSPTAFRVRSTNYLFPQSNLVFSSLLQHWEPFSGLTLSSCLEGCLDSIVLSRYQLQTELVSLSRFKWIGFKGYAVYTLPHELSPSQVKALNCLSDFAFYSGVGAKTTMGMGQTRRIESSFDL